MTPTLFDLVDGHALEPVGPCVGDDLSPPNSPMNLFELVEQCFGGIDNAGPCVGDDGGLILGKVD